jgi:hypothetical protein
MGVPAYVDGDIRIQFLSPSLVRIEQRGPKGFEDRPTFGVVGRSWTGTPFKKEGTRLVTSGYTVVLNGSQMQGIQVVVGGKTVYTVGQLPGKNWLPAPGKTGPVWAMADSPRLIPPKGGAIPANLEGPLKATSGYDTGNDAPDLYLFVTKDPKRLRTDFLKLTGPIPLVPRYTFGFWDSRWYPYTEKMGLALIDEYRKRGLPLDLFVVDTDWRVGASNGYATNTKLFPNMARFLSKAHAKGVRVMFNDHPEPQAPTALDPKETMYRWNGLSDLFRQGLDVWWYDRNWWTHLHEPMRGLSKETWGAAVFHDITLANRPTLRPMIMSNVDGIDNGIRNRPPDPAFHRYPIAWTGDTDAAWPYLRYAVENGVDEGVLGMLPYVHEDAGGHRPDNPTPELYTRFLQFCALSPVLRVHCTAGLTRYPWAFGPRAEEATFEAIRFRYRLIPTLYSASFRTHEDGTPLLRRLDLEWPNLPEATSSRQYLLGDDLLVSPVTDPELADLKPLPGTFRGEYFANKELEGEPVLTRDETKIDFDWRRGSPGSGVPNDNFSVRWTGQIGPMKRTMDYRIGTTSDDGVRLWVDGKKIVDAWGPADSDSKSATVRLEEGKTYDVRLEYQELTGLAKVHLGWGGDEPPKAPTWTFWCPPGTWIDPWSGARVVGPRTVTMPTDWRRVPMLIRDGAVLFLGDAKVRNSDEQMTKPITIEAYPGPATTRTLIEDDGISLNAPRTVRQATARRTATGAEVQVGAAKGMRDLIVRLHLRPGETAKAVTVGGKPVKFRVERPKGTAAGLGEIFAARGGSVVEVSLPKWSAGRSAVVAVRTR